MPIEATPIIDKKFPKTELGKGPIFGAKIKDEGTLEINIVLLDDKPFLVANDLLVCAYQEVVLWLFQHCIRLSTYDEETTVWKAKSDAPTQIIVANPRKRVVTPDELRHAGIRKEGS